MAFTINGTSGINLATQPLTGALPDANAPSGSVIQVVNATSNTQVTTTSTSYVTTGLTASITPSSSTSKILVIATFQAYANSGGLSSYFTLYRNSSEITSPEAFRMEAQSSAVATSCAISYLDSPATTSSTSYTVYMKSQTSSLTTYINLSGDKASITLMEIAA